MLYSKYNNIMNNIKITVDLSKSPFSEEYIDNKYNIIELVHFGACKYLQYAVTTQCRNEQSVVLSTGNKNVSILNKGLGPQSDTHYKFRKEGFIEVEGDKIILELSKEQFVLISSIHAKINSGETKAITCTVLFENSGKIDNDYNDACITLTAFAEKD